jgi:hypothetical protein
MSIFYLQPCSCLHLVMSTVGLHLVMSTVSLQPWSFVYLAMLSYVYSLFTTVLLFTFSYVYSWFIILLLFIFRYVYNHAPVYIEFPSTSQIQILELCPIFGWLS